MDDDAKKYQEELEKRRREEEEENRAQKAFDAYQKARSTKNAYDKLAALRQAKKSSQQISQSIKLAARAGRIVAVVGSNPAVAITIGVVILFILIFIIFFRPSGGGGGGSSPTPAPPAAGTGPLEPVLPPGLSLRLEGPFEVENGANILYRIIYSYDQPPNGASISAITIYSTFSENASFIRASGINNQDANTISWSLAEPANTSPLTLTLLPLGQDIIVENRLSATAMGLGTGSESAAGSNELSMLTRGMGRNTGMLGDKESFINTIIRNGAGRADFEARRDLLSQIYDAAVAKNVNPIFPVIIWGTESGFDTSSSRQYPFGCLGTDSSGFAKNLSCSVNTLDYWMRNFENNNVGGFLEALPNSTGRSCFYSDAFDYAYEMYAPVCHYNHGNDPAHANFVSFFKMFTGL